ncbi:MAG TPA: hypothetical protein VGJ36_09970 [Gemmatimonadales bacterium]
MHFLGPRPISSLDDLFHRADVPVSPRLKGLNTPMKIYSYLDSLATRLRTHTQVLDDHTAYLVAPEPEALGDGWPICSVIPSCANVSPARQKHTCSRNSHLTRRIASWAPFTAWNPKRAGPETA